jgi:Tol biopolymer transport system component
VFVRDRRAGTTGLVSVSSTGAQGNDFSVGSEISADGRYVAFTSVASNLVPGDTNNSNDVFVRDRRTGTTSRVSVTSTGAQASTDSYFSKISADGRYVAFSSPATNLVPDDTNQAWDVFVRDRRAGTTTRVSVTSTGAQASGGLYPSISANGRRIAFISDASDLVPGDTNGVQDVFLRDRHGSD